MMRDKYEISATDRLKRMLLDNPKLTVDDAVAALPDVKAQSIAPILSRLRGPTGERTRTRIGVRKADTTRSNEYQAIMKITGMYADDLITADIMVSMLQALIKK